MGGVGDAGGVVFEGLIQRVRALLGLTPPKERERADPCKGCRWRNSWGTCVLPSCFRQKEEGEWKKRNAR